MKFPFLRSQRIRSSRSFKQITDEGFLVRGEQVLVWVYKNPCQEPERQEDLPKLGIRITRKAEPLATKRNLWKRRIREIFRKNQAQMKPGFQVLVQARKQASVPSYEVLENELMRLLNKADVTSKQ